MTFQPPQSYRYLNQHMLHTLVNGHPESRSLLTLPQPDLHAEELLTSSCGSTCVTD
jgi:hypothetical protein